MKVEELAAKLIAAESEIERKKILDTNREQADLRLAFALKDAAYAAWTIEPARAQLAAAALTDLTTINADAKIAAVKIWIEGISALTRGENAEAVRLLDDAATRLNFLDENHFAAQTAVAKLFALAILGRYDEAIETGKSALAVFDRCDDQISAGKIEKNLGSLVGRRGRFKEAEQFFVSAHKRFLSLGDDAELAMVENNLAFVKTVQNDFRASETLYEKALARVAASGMKATEAEIQSSLGNLALFRGRFDDALKFLEKSRRNYSDLGLAHRASIVELEIADVYLELNLVTEAADIYARIAVQFDNLEMHSEAARTRLQLGKSLIQIGDFDAAHEQLACAAQLYEIEGNSVGAAFVRLHEGSLSLREEDFEIAKQFAAQSEQVFENEQLKRNLLLAKFVRGESERGLNNFTAARELFAAIVKGAKRSEQPQIIWASENALGQIAVAENNSTDAERHFKKAIKLVESLRQPLAADEFRTAFFADKLAPFNELARIYLKSGKTKQAFETIERARSQALLDLLSETVVANDSTEITDKIAGLREELNWFYSRLNRPAFGELKTTQKEIESWSAEIRRLEKTINGLTLQAGTENRSFSSEAKDFDLKRLQNQLGDERILVEFAEFDGKFTAFVVEQKTVKVFADLCDAADIECVLEAIHFQFGTLRYGTEALAKHLPELKRRTEKHLQNLYEILLRPLEKIVGKKHLIIVPSGALHYVPFQALHDGERYLIESHEISYAPSAGVLQNLLDKPASRFERVLAVGFADDRVPQVETEVLSLSGILPETRIFVGEAATFAAVRENLKMQFDILHLACHGQFRAENPLFSSLHLADGWATVRDAATLDLKNALVVLSACETGLNKIATGDELLGLLRGFLAAGANSLILTLWTVNDEATARLMQNFYRNLRAGKMLATSLRDAQLSFIAQNEHPYFWSPFALVGCW